MQDNNASDKLILAVETQKQLDRIKQEAIVATIPMAKMGEIIDNIHSLVKEHLKEGLHFGSVPGTDKMMLYKAGAELIAMYFQLRPEYVIDIKSFDDLNIEFAEFHREYTVKCKLMKYVGNNEYLEVSEGEGSCSTLESKYRYRKGDGIDTGQAPPKGYWEVYNRNKDEARKMVPKNHMVKKNSSGTYTLHQMVDKVANDNIADLWNTVKKMACKRAYVMAVQQFTAASNIFMEPDDPDEDLKPEVNPQQNNKPSEASYVEIIPSDENEPDITDLLDPKWFVKRIEAIKNEKEYQVFFSKYKKDITCFGGPELESITEATLKKKYEITNQKGQ